MFLLLLAFLTSAWSQSTVVVLREPVSFELPTMTKNKIVRGSELPIGSKVSVGDKGLVVLKNEDGSVVKITPNSSLEILKVAKMKSQEETLFNLVRGSAFFRVDKDKARNVKVKSRTVAFAVRGTEFFVSQAKSDDVWMCVNEGVVAVTTNTVKKAVLVKAGEGVHMPAGKEISPPKFLPWTSKLNWEMDPSNGSLDNTVSIEEAYASPLNFDID